MMEPTYRKRSGTTNRSDTDVDNNGHEYEKWNIANIVLNLLTHDEITNFYLSLNNDDFTVCNFDDIVIEIKENSTQKTYALQLKYRNRESACVSIHQFGDLQGDFSITQHVNAFQKLESIVHGVILYTNQNVQKNHTYQFDLKDSNFKIYVNKIKKKSNYLVRILDKHILYKFRMNAEDNQDITFLPYRKFFDTFFLLTKKEDLDKLKTNVKEKFSTLFCDNNTQFEEYVNIIMQWYSKTGNKVPKLSKKWMQLALALNILSDKIKDLDLTDRDNVIKALTNPSISESERLVLLNSLFDDKKDGRREILRQAISIFTVSVFENRSYCKLKKLWCDARSKLSTYDFNKIIHHYGIKANNISDVNQIDPLTASQLLWLNEIDCPLIVLEDECVYKAIKLCPDKKFVLLGEGSFTDDLKFFRSLADVQEETSLYNRIINNFCCSVQGKKEIKLANVLKEADLIHLETIKTDDLLQMLESPYTILGFREEFLETYIERNLYQNLISFDYLKNNNSDTLIIVEGDKDDINNLEDVLVDHTFIDVEDIYRTKSPSRRNHFSRTIFFSTTKCEYQQFREICGKNKVRNCHQFKLDNDKLKWIRSHGDRVSDLKPYELSESCSTEEKTLWLKPENNVNIVIGDDNVGKTELMKNFKNNCLSEFWTVIFSSEEIKSFLNYVNQVSGKTTSLSKLDSFLIQEKLADFDSKDKIFLELFMRQNKVICVWDGVDRLSAKELGDIIKVIDDLSKKRIQWITSRSNLREYLENKFKVFSLELKNDFTMQM